MDTHLLPEEKSKKYNTFSEMYFLQRQMICLTNLVEIFANPTESCPLVLIQQKAGSGLSALIRHVKAHHENHLEVCRFTFDCE